MSTVSVAFLLRRIILITLLFLPQRFWFGRGWRLAARIRRHSLRVTGQVLLVTAAVTIVVVLSDRIFRKLLPSTASLRIAPVVQLWVFTSTFAFFCLPSGAWDRVVLVTTDAIHLDCRGGGVEDPSRRSLFRYAASLAGTLPFVAAIYGFARERLTFEIVRVDVPIPNLPVKLGGLRIVQLSDIHIGDFMPREEVRRAVDMANGLAPHLAVITGDYLTSKGDPLDECIAELSRLRAPLGVWGCNGNHEIYADAEDATEVLFRQRNMKLLRQTAARLTWNGESLNLIGVDYQRVPLTGPVLPTLSGVEFLVRHDMPNILLSHNPNTFYHAAGLGVELTLAGHTHGGQINVEIANHSWSPARFMTGFIAGPIPTAHGAGGRALWRGV